MGQVRTTFTSEDKDVQKALDGMSKQLQRYAEENKKLKDQTKAGHETTKSWIGDTVAGLTKMVSGMAVFGAAIDVTNQKLQATVRLNKEAAQRATGAAATQSDFLNNLGLVSQKEQQSALLRVRGISQRTARPEQDLFGAASVAVSARGGMSISQALDAVEQASRLTADPGSMAQLSGAFLDIASLTKTTKANANAGFLLQLQAQSRVASQQQVAQNLVPGALGVAARGGTAGESAAIVSTLTSVLKDQTGAISGTAAIQLANQLAEFGPTKGKTPIEALRFLQQTPGAAQRFLGTASFEQKARFGIEQLVTGESEGAKLLERNVPAFGQPAALSRDFERFVASKMEVPLQKTDFQRRLLQSERERSDLANARGQLADEVRTSLERKLDELGVGDLDIPVIGRQGPRAWRLRDFDRAIAGGADPVEAAKDTLGRATWAKNVPGVGLGDSQLQALDRINGTLGRIEANQRTPDPERHRE